MDINRFKQISKNFWIDPAFEQAFKKLILNSIGTVEHFCQSNIIKYASRFGKKNGSDRSDLLKVIHYAILLYYFSGCQYPEDIVNSDFPH